MKVQKLNKELLNLYYKKNKRIHCQIVGDKTYVTDSYKAWILNSEYFMLNPINLKTAPITNCFNEDGYVDGVKTNELVQMEKSVGVYIENVENNIKVLVDIKFLDVFENYTLKIKSETSPVLVYENNELVGSVVPMRVY